MDKLRVLVLGRPEVLHGNKPLKINRRFIRSLLYYLACQSAAVTRNHLIVTFWPDDPEDTARQHLRENLSKLRHELPDPSMLVAEHDEVKLDREHVTVDMHEFLEINSHVQKSIQTGRGKPLPPNTYHQVLKAVNLWRSPQFLSGFDHDSSVEFDDWITITDQQLTHTRQAMLERLVDHSVAVGDPENAIRWLRLALEADQTNMDLHFRLLTCLDALGKRGEALNHFIYLRKVYERETGTRNLPPNFIRLHKKLLNLPEPPETTIDQQWPTSMAVPTPYVGNSSALQDLQHAFHRGGVAVVYGEAGAGKTRLIYELFRSLKPTPRLLLTHANPLESRVPFQPLIDGMRTLDDKDEWAMLEPVWATYLLPLVPELRGVHPSLQNVSSPFGDEARSGVFEAGRRLCLILAQTQRILLVLDDAQWSDESTLSALAYSVEHGVFTEKGLLILAIRQEEANPPLKGFLESAERSGPVTKIHLEQLEVNEVSELANYMLGRPLPQEVAIRLAADTGGNPFFLLEALRYLLGLPPATDLADAIEHMLPLGNIQSLLHSRLEHIRPAARECLTAAALIGREFSPNLIQDVTGMSPKHAVETLEELENAHLIRPNPDGSYVFIHDKFREAILFETSQARKRLLHQRVAHALETSKYERPVTPVVLAQHFEAAGLLSTACIYWCKAGQYAAKMFSQKEAYSAFLKAEQILQKLNYSLSEAQIYDLYITWGETAVLLNDQVTSREVFSTLKNIGKQKSSSLLVGSALSGLGNILIDTGQDDEAIIMLEQAIRLLEQTSNVGELIYAHQLLCIALSSTNRYAEVSSIYQRGLDLCKRATDTIALRAQTGLYNWVSMLYSLQGWPEKALSMANQALQISQLVPNDYGTMESMAMLAMAEYYRGNYSKALEICHAGMQLADSANFWRLSCMIHLTTARIHLLRGELDVCWDHVQQTMSLATNNHLYPFIEESLVAMGDIYRILLDHPQAIRAYQHAHNSNKIYYQSLDNQYRLAWALFNSGSPQQGMNLFTKVAEQAKTSDLGSLWLFAEYGLALINVTQGNIESARQKSKMLKEEFNQRAIKYKADLHWIEAQIALYSENIPEALDQANLLTVYAREEGLVFVEIEGLMLIKKIQRMLDIQDTEPGQRINELLESLNKRTQVADLRLSLEEYFHQVRQSIN